MRSEECLVELSASYTAILAELKDQIISVWIKGESIVQQLTAQITWFHNFVLLDKVKSQEERILQDALLTNLIRVQSRGIGERGSLNGVGM